MPTCAHVPSLPYLTATTLPFCAYLPPAPHLPHTPPLLTHLPAPMPPPSHLPPSHPHLDAYNGGTPAACLFTSPAICGMCCLCRCNTDLPAAWQNLLVTFLYRLCQRRHSWLAMTAMYYLAYRQQTCVCAATMLTMYILHVPRLSLSCAACRRGHGLCGNLPVTTRAIPSPHLPGSTDELCRPSPAFDVAALALLYLLPMPALAVWRPFCGAKPLLRVCDHAYCRYWQLYARLYCYLGVAAATVPADGTSGTTTYTLITTMYAGTGNHARAVVADAYARRATVTPRYIVVTA